GSPEGPGTAGAWEVPSPPPAVPVPAPGAGCGSVPWVGTVCSGPGPETSAAAGLAGSPEGPGTAGAWSVPSVPPAVPVPAPGAGCGSVPWVGTLCSGPGPETSAAAGPAGSPEGPGTAGAWSVPSVPPPVPVPAPGAGCGSVPWVGTLCSGPGPETSAMAGPAGSPEGPGTAGAWEVPSLPPAVGTVCSRPGLRGSLRA